MKKLHFLFFLLLLFAVGILEAQSPNWVCPPYKVMPRASGFSQVSIAGAPLGTYRVSNGVYDEAGALRFYVRNDQVYTAAGAIIGTLPNIISTATASAIQHEVCIVPVPGECAKYYVIYYKGEALDLSVVGGNLAYVIVDCSSSTPIMTIPSNNNLAENGYNDWFLSGLAVSKVVGSNPEKRNLFWLSPNSGIYRFDILKTGISSTANTVVEKSPLFQSQGVSASVGFSTTELELSPDQQWMAWGDYRLLSQAVGKVYLVKLNATGAYQPNTYREISLPSGVTQVKGVEFNASSNELYVSAGNGTNGGLYKITNFTAASPTLNIFSGTSSMNNTQLEMSVGGGIYGMRSASGSAKLTRVSVSGGLTDYGVLYDSNLGYSAVSGQGVVTTLYTLPDQIDGEDYSYFTGQTLASLNSFTLDNTTLSTVCTSPTVFYRCVGSTLPLSAVVTGNNDPDCTTEYKLDIYSVAGTACSQISGTAYLNYTSGWTSSNPNGSNIRTLTGSNGVNLNNINLSTSNKFKVIVSVRNCCGRLSTLNGIFSLGAPPTAANTALTINSGGGTPQLPSTTIPVSGVLVGGYSASFNISQTSGTITFYRIQVSEVDCSTGASVQSLYDVTTPTTSVSNLTAISLNSLTIPAIPSIGWAGGQGYFAFNNGQFSLGKCFKLTVTAGNPCGSSTKFSYIKMDGMYRLASRGETVALEETESGVYVYPNPLNGTELQVVLDLLQEGEVTLNLYDQNGKQVFSQLDTKQRTIGKQIYRFDVDLPHAGIYFYQITTPDAKYSGKLLKLNE